MNQTKWLALVALPIAIMILGYIGVRIFEFVHRQRIAAVPPSSRPEQETVIRST
jgi:hypothetical protein